MPIKVQVELSDDDARRVLDWVASFEAAYPSDAQRDRHQVQTYMRVTYLVGLSVRTALGDAEKPQQLRELPIG